MNDSPAMERLAAARNGRTVEWSAGHIRQVRSTEESTVRHGTRSGYSNGCRCESCKEAAAASKRKWRQHRRDQR